MPSEGSREVAVRHCITAGYAPPLYGAELLDGAGDGVIYRIAGLGEGGLAGKLGSEGAVGIRISRNVRRGVKHTHKMIGQDMFQEEMEAVTMVLVAQVAELVQKDVVLKHARQAHDAEVQVYIALGRAASPVGCIVLDGDPVVCETVSGGKFGETPRELSFGLTAERLDLL